MVTQRLMAISPSNERRSMKETGKLQAAFTGH
jgi:hypothetical protein